MKQNITHKQIKELSRTQQARLKEWCKKHNYETYNSITKPYELLQPLLTIGEMFQFIGDYYESQGTQETKTLIWTPWEDDRLCDDLWEKVKKALEDELFHV